MVATSSAWIHKLYLNYFNQKSKQIINLINSKRRKSDCESIAINMIVSEITRNSPIALTPKLKKIQEEEKLEDTEIEADRNDCLNKLVKILDGNYLVKSQFRRGIDYLNSRNSKI